MAKPKLKPALKSAPAEIVGKFFRGLGDSTRIRIVEALLESERNVSELIRIIGAPQSNISNHLACLKWCGYIASRKQGTSVYYQINDDRVRKIMSLAKAVLADHAENLLACTRIKG